MQYINEVLSSQVGVRVSREIIRPRDNHDDPPIELIYPDKHADDSPTGMEHNALSIIDPGGEVCVRLEKPC